MDADKFGYRYVFESNGLVSYHIGIVIELICALNAIGEDCLFVYVFTVCFIDEIAVIDVIVTAEERNYIGTSQFAVRAVIFISVERVLAEFSLT